MARSSRALPKVVAYGWDSSSRVYVPIPTDSGGALTHPPYYAIRYDDVGGGITYIGQAAPGTATSSASWQILKLDESASPDFTVLYAGGNAGFDKIWDNRAALSYS